MATLFEFLFAAFLLYLVWNKEKLLEWEAKYLWRDFDGSDLNESEGTDFDFTES